MLTLLLVKSNFRERAKICQSGNFVNVKVFYGLDQSHKSATLAKWYTTGNEEVESSLRELTLSLCDVSRIGG